MRHTRQQLPAVLDERVSDALLVGCLHVVQRFVHRQALAAEHDTADRQSCWLSIEIGDRERRLVRTDTANLRVTNKKLQQVRTWEQREAGVVLHWLRDKAFRVRAGQRYIEPVAHVPLGRAE